MSNFNFGPKPPTPAYAPQGFTPPAPAPAYAPQAPAAPAPAFQGFAPPAPAAPAVNPASPFAGLAGTQTYAKGAYFDIETDKGPTVALCRIVDILLKNTFNNGASIIVELEVLQTNNPNVPPGTKRGSVYPLAKAKTSYPNLITLIGAILGFSRNKPEDLQMINGPVTQQSESILTAAVTDGQKVFNGYLVVASSRSHTTKEKQIRTILDFSPAPNAIPGQGIKG